jgi:uncharacterized protein YbbC (DUF1343 family)
MGKPPKIARALAQAGCLGLLLACNGQAVPEAVRPAETAPATMPLRTGAERMEEYLPLLQGRRVAVVTNQTGRVGEVHLVDTLLARGVQVVKVFAPEHGFRGMADAGERIHDDRDAPTGLPVISLYGRNKKPAPAQLKDVDLLLFDIQDVGVRFYTYISTLHYVMEAAAELGKPVLVLDRPNPNGFAVDGPVLDTAYRSFVGMDPVPLVHGLTMGEYARMLNGEGWLRGGERCALQVIACSGYDRTMHYVLPVRPSPNLPDMAAVRLYPSLGLFEGTVVSVGRGTEMPFQCIGYPKNPWGALHFTPLPMPGAKDPPYKGILCTGLDLRQDSLALGYAPSVLDLRWLLGMYAHCPDRATFFNNFFDTLAGGPALRQAIQAGWTEDQIKQSWQPALDAFKEKRRKYLLYP